MKFGPIFSSLWWGHGGILGFERARALQGDQTNGVLRNGEVLPCLLDAGRKDLEEPEVAVGNVGVVGTYLPPEQPEESWVWVPSLSDVKPPTYDLEVIRAILQSSTHPWRDVSGVNPDMYQSTVDGLQAVLDSPPMETSPTITRAAAFKSLLAMNRMSGLLPTQLKLRNIELVSPLDRGGYADVFKGRNGCQIVCVKRLTIMVSSSGNDAEKMEKSFCREVLLLRQLQHPRILPLYGVATDMTHKFWLVTPLMKNGNIIAFLKKKPTFKRFKMVLEIAEGIEYLHTHNPPVVHGDIRGVNILVRDDLTCCLADFGLSMLIESRIPSRSRSNIGAMYWTPPESFESNEPDTPARDIYAFGCTVIEIYSGKHPFPDINPFSIQHLMHQVIYKKCQPPRPTELDNDMALWEIVVSCLAFKAEERPNATVILDRLRTLASSR